MTKAEEYILENFLAFNFSQKEQLEFTKVANKIIYHKEFEKRCQEPFYHHDKITLGEHIIKDAIVTYRLAKRYKYKHPKKYINIEDALLIAFFHDLYDEPWQNKQEGKRKLLEKHGFIHPIEAAINASKWYPTFFKDKRRKEKLIDGIIHHMYPFPVRTVTKKTKIKGKLLAEEKIYKTLKKVTKEKKRSLIIIKKPTSIEGKLLSKADKKIALQEMGHILTTLKLLYKENKTLAEDNNL